MRFRVILLLLFFVMLFLVACGSGDNWRNFAMECNDKVIIRGMNEYLSQGEVCYNDRGVLEFGLLNLGELPFYGYEVTVFGDDDIVNVTFPEIVAPMQSTLVSMYLQLSKTGKITRVEVRPRIMYENEVHTCNANRAIFREVGVCYEGHLGYKYY